MTIEKKVELYDLFLSACGSDNTDYIAEQLEKLYVMICEENIGRENFIDGKISLYYELHMKYSKQEKGGEE